MKKLNINKKDTHPNQKLVNSYKVILAAIFLMSISTANAAISLDRTRAIINGNEKSISLNISNENKTLPYLAQGWIENAQGEKINDPFTVLPPVQRVEPGDKSQIRIQPLASIEKLPQDIESVYYFNLREIPPRSDKANTLQLALQTRIKLFYRPTPIISTKNDIDNPWQEKLVLKQQGGKYIAFNPTPYYITIIEAAKKIKGDTVKGFEPIMIAPKNSQPLGVDVATLGNTPVLTYINDYGGRPNLSFNCQANECKVSPSNK